MTPLPNDISRCVGRTLDPDAPVCERRDTCARYLSMLAEPGRSYAEPYVPVATYLCRGGVDAWLAVEGTQNRS